VQPSEFGVEEMAHLANETRRQQPASPNDRVVRLPEKDMRLLRTQQRQNQAMFSRQLSKVAGSTIAAATRALMPVTNYFRLLEVASLLQLI